MLYRKLKQLLADRKAYTIVILGCYAALLVPAHAATWTYKEDHDAITKKPILSISKKGELGYTCSNQNDNTRSKISFICDDGKMKVEVDTGCYINWLLANSSKDVYFNYDHQTPVKTDLFTRHDRTMTILDQPDAINFTRESINHKRVGFDVLDFKKRKITNVFELDGLKTAIAPIRKACHW